MSRHRPASNDWRPRPPRSAAWLLLRRREKSRRPRRPGLRRSARGKNLNPAWSPEKPSTEELEEVCARIDDHELTKLERRRDALEVELTQLRHTAECQSPRLRRNLARTAPACVETLREQLNAMADDMAEGKLRPDPKWVAKFHSVRQQFHEIASSVNPESRVRKIREELGLKG